jgi:hypothetical protein
MMLDRNGNESRTLAVQASVTYWKYQGELWLRFFADMLGADAVAVAVPEHGGRQFDTKDWSSNGSYSLAKPCGESGKICRDQTRSDPAGSNPKAVR